MATFPDAEMETIRNLDDDGLMGEISEVMPGTGAEEKTHEKSGADDETGPRNAKQND